MTDKQLRQKKKELQEEINANGCGWIDGKYIKPPKKYENARAELFCINMINSILCYDCKGYQDAEKVLEYEEKSYRNYLAEYIALFGRKKVIELIQGQINSIDDVKCRVYTDSEGLSYNSIVWKDE